MFLWTGFGVPNRVNAYVLYHYFLKPSVNCKTIWTFLMNWKYHNHFHDSICEKKLFQNSMCLFGRMALVNVKTTLT